MNWDDFAARNVKIEYANMAKMNKIRAWARKHQSHVEVERYAKDAYNGYVKIYMTQGREQQDALVKELEGIL